MPAAHNLLPWGSLRKLVVPPPSNTLSRTPLMARFPAGNIASRLFVDVFPVKYNTIGAMLVIFVQLQIIMIGQIS
jgi:hypothetical protein